MRSLWEESAEKNYVGEIVAATTTTPSNHETQRTFGIQPSQQGLDFLRGPIGSVLFRHIPRLINVSTVCKSVHRQCEKDVTMKVFLLELCMSWTIYYYISTNNGVGSTSSPKSAACPR
jgi:hypothetical protein